MLRYDIRYANRYDSVYIVSFLFLILDFNISPERLAQSAVWGV